MTTRQVAWFSSVNFADEFFQKRKIAWVSEWVKRRFSAIYSY